MLGLLIYYQGLIAQKPLKQGKIEYSIQIPEFDLGSDGESDGFDISQMLDNFKMNIYWNNKRSRTEINVMNGLIHTQYFKEMKGDAVTMFYDMMGRKYKIRLQEDELNQIKDQGIKEMPVPDITRFSGQRKEILGYDCYRIKIDYGTTDGPDMEAYVAPSLQVPIVGYGMESLNLGTLNGVPLEYTLSMSGVKIVISAINLSTKVRSADLEYPGGYTEKTLEEFANEMGSFKF